MLEGVVDRVTVRTQAASPATRASVAQASMSPPGKATTLAMEGAAAGAGDRSRIRANKPITWAAAYDEPDTRFQRPPGRVVGTSRPGATSVPRSAGSPVSSATATTPACDAGN